LTCLQVYSFRGSVKEIIMHELKIAADLSAIVLEAAKKGKLTRVTKVNVIFGQMVQIVPDIFRFAFSETVRDSIAENAEIEIEVLPIKMKCVKCNSEVQVSDNEFRCNVCGSTELEFIQGKELFVNSIEGE